jgi:hypothetical protein
MVGARRIVALLSALVLLLVVPCLAFAQVRPVGVFALDGSDVGPTPGTMAVISSGRNGSRWRRYDWANAQVAALGAVGAGDIAVCTLQAKTVVKNAYVVINTPDTSANALTVAAGTVTATYLDLVAAGDAKAAANTIYGDASGERGTNATGYWISSWTAGVVVNAHFIKSTTNLSTVVGSTGSVYLETEIVP